MLVRALIEKHDAILGGTVSVLAARPAVSELERHGIDVGPLLARARLSGELLADGDARVPHRSVADLWEAAARATGDRSFGLHVAERLPEGTFDVCDYLVASSATVGEGLAAVTRYARLIHDDAEWQLTGLRLVRRVPTQDYANGRDAHHTLVVYASQTFGREIPRRSAILTRRTLDRSENARIRRRPRQAAPPPAGHHLMDRQTRARCHDAGRAGRQRDRFLSPRLRAAVATHYTLGFADGRPSEAVPTGNPTQERRPRR